MALSEWLKRSFLFRLSYIILVVFAFKLYLDKVELKNALDTREAIASDKTNEKLEKIDGVQQKPQQEGQDAVNVYDLNAPLEPAELFDSVQCKTSRELYSITTTLCVHDLKNDIYVSGSIWRNGIYELPIMSVYMDYISKNPDWMVLDMGAQVGQFTLFAASAGRHVVTVEPFYDNIVRIHKASAMAKTQGNIKLLANALSNKRGEIKQLQQHNYNIGAQSLLQNKNKVITRDDIDPKDPNAKYYVETILLDDLVPHLPVKNDGKKYEKAIMKIDIEGFEPYAFQYASKLFDTLEVPIIFMEWVRLKAQTDMKSEIEAMITFLESRNYKAWHKDVVLNRNSWSSGWPWNIIWKKEGY